MNENLKPQFNIEVGKPEDAEGIQEVVEVTWEATYPRVHENPKYNLTVEDLAPRFVNREKRIQRSREILENPGDGRTFVAKDESGKVVGMCGVEKSNDENRIRSLYLLPKYQGKGIGGQLMLKALEFLGENERIVLNVANYNESAIKFYEKFGFKKTKDLPEDEHFIQGKVIPEMEMVRENN